MPAPTTSDDFLELVVRSGLLTPQRLHDYLEAQRARGTLPEPRRLASRMARDGVLTAFQAGQLLRGRYRNFTIGKYTLLEPIGTGGMSKVFLCEHRTMGHRVAMKVLTLGPQTDPSLAARFEREARAAASLNHPNVVRAHDIDGDGDRLLYIIMDYIEGVSLHDLVRKRGPLDAAHAAHYVAQAAEGLQHIHEAGLVHRDIKPGNLLVDTTGTVKILDLGLARFLRDTGDALTRKYDHKAVLGTADYLSPEQALRSSGVDIRADVYSLGATAYFLLTGRAPFESERNVTQKLLGHQLRQPSPLASLRPGLPPALVAVVERMMAKQPGDRYQEPIEVADALAPWTQTPIPPPGAEDIPRRGGSAPPAASTSHNGRTARLSASTGGSLVRRGSRGDAPTAAAGAVTTSVPLPTGPRRPTLWPRVDLRRRGAKLAAAGVVLALTSIGCLFLWRPWAAGSPAPAGPNGAAAALSGQKDAGPGPTGVIPPPLLSEPAATR
jgi:serine/threonine protein kinase